MKKTVTIEINTDELQSYTDGYVAQLWHIAQANPAPLEDMEAAHLAETIGFEIISRWLKTTPGELYHHQGRHPYWFELCKHGKWVDGVFELNGEKPESERA